MGLGVSSPNLGGSGGMPPRKILDFYIALGSIFMQFGSFALGPINKLNYCVRVATLCYDVARLDYYL